MNEVDILNRLESTRLQYESAYKNNRTLLLFGRSVKTLTGVCEFSS